MTSLRFVGGPVTDIIALYCCAASTVSFSEVGIPAGFLSAKFGTSGTAVFINRRTGEELSEGGGEEDLISRFKRMYGDPGPATPPQDGRERYTPESPNISMSYALQ